jgi:hypothetical protein
MTTQLTTISRRVCVGARMAVADIGSGLSAAARRRAAVREYPEHGAQAAEYAMLGGVSAAACTGLVAIFKNKETLRTLVDAVIGTLGKVIEGWF